MAYKHGVYTSELPTSIIPAVNSNAGLPVVYGTAPLHLASDPAPANRPVLCYSYAEAVAAFGYSKNWKEFTLCEAIYSQFALYNVAPIVFVNVLDPAVHKTTVANSTINFVEGVAKVNEPVMLDTLVVRASAAGQPLENGVDYEALYDDDGVLNITALKGGSLESAENCTIGYNKLNPGAVEADEIIGGIDNNTGAKKGLETLDQIFPLFGLVPGMVLAPGWSQKPEVAAVMKAKAGNINGHFKASVLTDIPTDEVEKYTDVSAWKNANSYTGNDQIVCWPMVKMGDDIYHMSTHVMGIIGQTDAANGDIPYVSPSNKAAQINGMCLEDGSEVILDNTQATYLNSQGVVTCLNFIGSWKLWGNRTGCYPGNTDPKDAFISIRRMFNWHAQTFIQTYWAKVDQPINKRLIQTIMDSENIRINGFVAQGVLLGGRIEFVESENPVTNLMDGIIKFHTYFTPPTPARVIENVIEYDPQYFQTLFN